MSIFLTIVGLADVFLDNSTFFALGSDKLTGNADVSEFNYFDLHKVML